MGIGCLNGPKVPKSKLRLPRVTMELDKSVNQSLQGGLEKIYYTSSFITTIIHSFNVISILTNILEIKKISLGFSIIKSIINVDFSSTR